MKIRFLLLCVMLGLCGAQARAEKVDSLFFDARGSFLQTFAPGGKYTSTMKPEYFNLHVYGHISDNVTYRIRHRLNVPVDATNPFRATDWLCLNWQASPKLRLYAGKTPILIGGYEYDSAPIDVYFYSLFCSNLSQYFAFSTGGEYELLPGQKLALQVSNSPLTNGFNNMYAYNAAWIGGFSPWWKTIWSCNLIDDQFGRTINYLALGNHCVWGGLAVDLDFINRASFSQQRFLFSDFSLISKVIYSIGRWNLCGKLGYECNEAGNVDSLGRPFDTAVTPGTDYLYWGYGVEYFPFGNDDLRLHMAGFTDSVSREHTITAGVKWRFRIL